MTMTLAASRSIQLHGRNSTTATADWRWKHVVALWYLRTKIPWQFHATVARHFAVFSLLLRVHFCYFFRSCIWPTNPLVCRSRIITIFFAKNITTFFWYFFAVKDNPFNDGSSLLYFLQGNLPKCRPWRGRDFFLVFFCSCLPPPAPRESLFEILSDGHFWWWIIQTNGVVVSGILLFIQYSFFPLKKRRQEVSRRKWTFMQQEDACGSSCQLANDNFFDKSGSRECINISGSNLYYSRCIFMRKNSCAK